MKARAPAQNSSGVGDARRPDRKAQGTLAGDKPANVTVPLDVLEQQNRILEVQKEYYSIGESSFNMIDGAQPKPAFSPQPEPEDLEFKVSLRNKSLSGLEMQELAFQDSQERPQQNTERQMTGSSAKKTVTPQRPDGKLTNQIEDRRGQEFSWPHVSQS